MKHSTKLLTLILISTSFLFGYGAATGHQGLPLLLAQSPAKENPQPQKPGDAPTTDWREQYAYTLGVQAYLYAFPWAYMPEARWARTEPVNRQANRFAHARTLVDASWTNGGAPNNDALYSRAVIYLQDDPIILSVPEIRDRYYTMEIADFMGDNFAYVGVRTTGTQAGNYAIVGPGWQGALPAGVKPLPASPTPWAWILGRTLVKDANDLQAVWAIQDQYKLTPLSQWKRPDVKLPEGPEIWKPLDPKDDPLAEWKTINRAMVEVPPPARDASLLQWYARIGIGPKLDVEALDPSTKRGLARAAVDGHKLIAEAFAGGYLGKQVNGWHYPPPSIGRPTATGDWLFRAMQALAGFLANDPEEAIYLSAKTDGEGKPLSGANRYVIRFEKDGLPPVKAFWSVTMYNMKYNLVANPINRYSLGDRSGMKTDKDGSLTIYVQKDSPGADKEANWLPAPEGEFFFFLRTYLPGEALVNQTWQPPSLTRVEK
jgi:hypothetical protein